MHQTSRINRTEARNVRDYLQRFMTKPRRAIDDLLAEVVISNALIGNIEYFTYVHK